MKNLFKNFGFSTKDVFNLTPTETYNLCKEDGIIIDVREEYLNGFKKFKVENIIYCPKSVIEQKYKEFPTDKPLIIADSTGIRSKECFQLLEQKGLKNIANMAGGILEWERDGLPIDIDINERLSGSCMCQLRPREKK